MLTRERMTEWAARRTLQHPRLEQLLVAGCRHPVLRRRLRLGAIALAYPRALGRQELRVAEMDRYRMLVNVGEPLGIQPYFFRDPCTLWITEELIAPGDTCVDAGANAGPYTFFMASRVGPTGRVFAIEPNPSFVDLLKRSITLNGFSGRVHVEPRALWRESGQEMRLYLSQEPTNSGVSSLVQHGVFISEDHTHTVQTLTLADLAAQHQVERFALVKVDIERAEDAAVEGMGPLLTQRRINYIIVELEAQQAAHQRLRSLGYVDYLIQPKARRLVPGVRVEERHFGDYLFVSPHLAEAFAQRFAASIG